ncbi:MAG: hypothetical protein HQK52_24095 [Oligoflexia bacterium]|nr:hypothetical protein [Oligoflexia bacterium]
MKPIKNCSLFRTTKSVIIVITFFLPLLTPLLTRGNDRQWFPQPAQQQGLQNPQMWPQQSVQQPPTSYTDSNGTSWSQSNGVWYYQDRNTGQWFPQPAQQQEPQNPQMWPQQSVQQPPTSYTDSNGTSWSQSNGVWYYQDRNTGQWFPQVQQNSPLPVINADEIKKQLSEKYELYTKYKLITQEAADLVPDNGTKASPEMELFKKNHKKFEEIQEEISQLERKMPPNANKISQEECDNISFDNRKLMAPDSNQRSSSICSIHAMSALVEEQICLATKDFPAKGSHGQKNYCGEQISRTNIAAKVDDYNYMQDGLTTAAQKQTLDSLVNDDGSQACLNKYAPNPVDYFGDIAFIKILKDAYKTKKDLVCSHSPIMDARLGALVNLIFPMLENILQQQEGLQSVKKVSLTKEDLKKILYESHNENEFTIKTLTFYCNKALGNVSFKRGNVKLKARAMIYPNVINNAKDGMKKIFMIPFLTEMAQAKKAGHSLLFGFCYNAFIANNALVQGQNAAELNKKDPCGAHSVVVNGARWNNIKGQCEVFIKNSHGAGPGVKMNSDWYSAEVFFSHSMDSVFYDKDK